MNKTNKLLAFFLFTLMLISCNTKEKKSSIVTVNKDTLSSWALENGALWTLRLDMNGANLSGTPFSMLVKFADSGEVTCLNTILAGSEGNGSYQTGVCSVTFASAMANGVGGVAFEQQGMGGTYTNTGTTFEYCRNVANCFVHH